MTDIIIIPQTVYFGVAQLMKMLKQINLHSLIANFNLNGGVYPDVNNAIRSALAKASKKDLILVCGSVFLIGEVNV